LKPDGIIIVAVPKSFTMKSNEDRKDMRSTQEGTGSAEDTGRRRGDQKNRSAALNADEKQQLAKDSGLDAKNVADVNDLGTMSGRDDYAGNYNDGMSGESTGEPTDR